MNFNILNQLFGFVLGVCSKYNIDESHGLSHSMDVLNFAHDIYEAEKYIYPALKEQENIIYISSVLHDMCDKKYMNEEEGLQEINKFLGNIIKEEEKEIILKIISTMSYSKVKTNGFPELGKYQMAYHCVREADLLAAYDFDRCVIFDMYSKGNLFEKSFEKAEILFKERVFKHAEDNLLTTQYSLAVYPNLHLNAMNRIKKWKNILKVKT
jgi:HD superfamily phosphodiesterase